MFRLLYYEQIDNGIMKKTLILALLVIMMSSCTDNSSTSKNGNVTLKASAVSTSGLTFSAARMASTVVITDFKINIGNIKFETDEDDDRYNDEPSHEDVKLMGPFLLDLLDTNKTLSQTIASLAIPNAKYEEIKFKFETGIEVGDMFGKSILIKGTIDGKEFVFWSDKDVELEIDFNEPSKDFTVNSNDISLNIKIQLDALMAKFASLASQNLLLDTDGDGVIEISTRNDDGHHDIGELIRDLLEHETHLDDKD
ncbi:MAG: hypothetical protein ACI9WT_001208 [Flavobacterium sp.]|jgi:hypothetical protein